MSVLGVLVRIAGLAATFAAVFFALREAPPPGAQPAEVELPSMAPAQPVSMPVARPAAADPAPAVARPAAVASPAPPAPPAQPAVVPDPPSPELLANQLTQATVDADKIRRQAFSANAGGLASEFYGKGAGMQAVASQLARDGNTAGALTAQREAAGFYRQALDKAVASGKARSPAPTGRKTSKSSTAAKRR
jgi:hypothetical protein